MFIVKFTDKNTNFFHKQLEGRNTFKAAKEIQNQGEGEMIQNFKEIKKVTHSHFHNIYTEEIPSGSLPNSPILNSVLRIITHSINRILVAPISKKEVKRDLAGMESDKALDPDGFMAIFSKA